MKEIAKELFVEVINEHLQEMSHTLVTTLHELAQAPAEVDSLLQEQTDFMTR